MIYQESGVYFINCDKCSNDVEIDNASDWYDMISKLKKDYGWKVKKVCDQWEHHCNLH